MTLQTSVISDPLITQCLDTAAQAATLSHELAALMESTRSTPEALSDDALIARSRKQKELSTQVHRLKFLHRTAIMAGREAKETTADSRREVDRLHLQLQNLYYEQRHLRGEIAACRDYPHKYSSLPLISEEEFLVQHPEYEDETAHELMLARLQNEKEVREDLERQGKELLARKKALSSENKKRKEDLASLDDQLKKFIDVGSRIRWGDES